MMLSRNEKNFSKTKKYLLFITYNKRTPDWSKEDIKEKR